MIRNFRSMATKAIKVTVSKVDTELTNKKLIPFR